MATSATRPTSAALRLIEGNANVTRHGTEDELRAKVEASLSAFGPLIKPSHLKGEASKAWDRYIQPAAWLDASREVDAIAFCELWRQFRKDPEGFVAAKHGQMRAYMAELGLTDERNRTTDYGKRSKDEFFDD